VTRARGLTAALAGVLLVGGAVVGWRFGAAASAGPAGWGVVAEWGPDAVRLEAAAGDRQRERDGCGAAALHIVLRAHGVHVPQRLLWSMCRVPRGGTTLGTLARAARNFGLHADLGAEPSLDDARLPAIVHLRRGHFVVLESRTGSTAVLFDPACGRVRVPLRVLQRRASGAVLEITADAS
jgi:ABC-type bacteriocin/lantibiotic exporter with double-glycine peptidase domain